MVILTFLSNSQDRAQNGRVKTENTSWNSWVNHWQEAESQETLWSRWEKSQEKQTEDQRTEPNKGLRMILKGRLERPSIILPKAKQTHKHRGCTGRQTHMKQSCVTTARQRATCWVLHTFERPFFDMCRGACTGAPMIWLIWHPLNCGLQDLCRLIHQNLKSHLGA